MQDLELSINKLLDALDFEVSVSAHNLETGQRLDINADQSRWLASTYKIPLAVRVLHDVERGELALDQQVEILHDDYISPGLVSEWLDAPGTRLPLITLLTLTMTHSDNSATDVLFRLVGGPEKVMELLAHWNVDGLNVSRNTADLITDYFDSPAMRARRQAGQSPKDAWANTLANEKDRADWDSRLAKYQADQQYQKALMADPRDKGTARAMTDFLSSLWRGEYVSADSVELLNGIMQRCVTGDNRIRAGAPSGSIVADKTGSLFPVAGAINDTALVTLPNGHPVVLTVYTTIQGEDIDPQESAIATIADLVLNYFNQSQGE